MRREMTADIGPWRFSNEIRGINASQDFLYRARKAGKRMVLDRRVSCLVFSSGDRRNSYKVHDGSELAAWFKRPPVNAASQPHDHFPARPLARPAPGSGEIPVEPWN